MLLISVIITVLNDKRIERVVDKLEEIIDCDKVEVIITDGGSIDGTWELALKLSSRYKNVRVIKAPGTVAYSRNRAIDIVQGRFIAFIDADEYPDDKWLDTLYSAINRNEKTGFAGGPTPPYEYEKYTITAKYYSSYIDWFYDSTAPRKPEVIPMGNSIWRREVFETVGRLDETISSGEDHDFANRAIAHGWEGIYVKEAILYHDYTNLTIRKLWRKQAKYAMEGMFIYKRYSSTYETTKLNVVPYLLLPVSLFLSLITFFVLHQIAVVLFLLGIADLLFLFIYLEIKGIILSKYYTGLKYGWIEIIRKYAVLWGVLKWYLKI